MRGATLRQSSCPEGVDGRLCSNGSGENGSVRILRTARRTRMGNPAKLKVLATS